MRSRHKTGRSSGYPKRAAFVLNCRWTPAERIIEHAGFTASGRGSRIRHIGLQYNAACFNQGPVQHLSTQQ